MPFLSIFDPGRAAWCKHWERTAVLQSFSKFTGFFNNCQVSAYHRIKYLVNAQHFQSLNSHSHYIFTVFNSKLIAQSYSHCRCNLYDNHFLRIVQIFPHTVSFILYRNCSGRTYGSTLSAVYAVCFCQGSVKSRHNLHFWTAISKIQNTKPLLFTAYTHAVAAEDTFVRITNKTCTAWINLHFIPVILESNLFNSVAESKLLQTAWSVLVTSRAVTAVCWKKKLYNHSSVLYESRSICLYFHTVPRYSWTSGFQSSAFIFYHAHTAGAICG